MNKDTFITENAYGEDKSSLKYWKPTELANIPYDKVFMCCIKVEKDSKSPGIFIDIID